MAFLKILTGEKKGERIEIDRDKISFGRASDNVIPLDDPAVSSHHGCVLRDGRKFTLQDLDSTNGTLLNKVKVKEYQLSPRDVIQVGAIEIMIDGKDIDSADPIPSKEEDTQLTVKMDINQLNLGGAPSPAFGVKKERRMGWVVGIGVVGLLALAAGAWFIIRILGSGG